MTDAPGFGVWLGARSRDFDLQIVTVQKLIFIKDKITKNARNTGKPILKEYCNKYILKILKQSNKSAGDVM